MGKIIEFDYMDKDVVVLNVKMDVANKRVKVTKYRREILDNVLPDTGATVSDVMEMLEDRCFPRTRGNARELLDHLGLDSYDPYEIAKKTRGQQWDDFNWVRFKGDTVEYKDIKLRN